jgi:hypothetical protein
MEERFRLHKQSSGSVLSQKENCKSNQLVVDFLGKKRKRFKSHIPQNIKDKPGNIRRR